MTTQEDVKKLYKYNPETGVFLRKQRCGACKAGTEAGGLSSNGYVIILVDGKRYRAHRLAWLYMTGELPDKIDHLNRIRNDNRWDNLRNCTDAENLKNKSLHSHNRSGINGVSWYPRTGKWRAHVKADNKFIHLGFFNTKIAAAYARHQANIDYGFSSGHGL